MGGAGARLEARSHKIRNLVHTLQHVAIANMCRGRTSLPTCTVATLLALALRVSFRRTWPTMIVSIVLLKCGSNALRIVIYDYGSVSLFNGLIRL